MPRKRSLHAMLLTRLVLATTLISVVVAVLVIFNERSRVFKVATDRALIRTGTLRMLVLKQLDTTVLGDRAELEAMLKAVAYKGFDLNTGYYVFLRILDPSFHEVTRTEDPDHDNIDALERHVESGGFRPSPGGLKPEIIRTRVRDTKYLHALVPLLNSQGVVAAYVEGFFAISREGERKILLDLLRAVGLAVGIVIATSLLLYPVILRLMRRLARLSRSLLDSNLEALSVVGSTIAKRDSDTDVHNFRVTIYSVRIAESLGLDDQTIRLWEP